MRASEEPKVDLDANPVDSAQIAAMELFLADEEADEEVLEEVEISVDKEEPVARPTQAVVAALGFIADLGPLQQWGIEVEKRHVVVSPSMQTSLERVFAAGDVTEYPGKVRLIAVGFGEAATAVNNAAVAIDPSAHVFPASTSMSCGSPSTRSATMLRCTSPVPPPTVSAGENRKP